MIDHPLDTKQLQRPVHDSRMNLWNRAGESLSLQDSFDGQALVITLGGPSLARSDLDGLRASGITTMGVNNSWAVYRPDFWICVDPASTFSDRGWADPRIRKLAPASEMLTRLRAKREDGSFRTLAKVPASSPNTLFYKRGVGFVAEEFLNGPIPTIGVGDQSRCMQGLSGGRSVFFAAIRMAHYLGFRRVYLLGADFNMDDGGSQYAAGEACGDRHSRGNNRSYQTINARMKEVRPVLEADGMRVINITDGSGLDAFDFAKESDIYDREAIDGPVGSDSQGWYERHSPVKFSEIAWNLTRGAYGYSHWHQRIYMMGAAMIHAKDSSVLDVGCGAGVGLEMLRAAGGEGHWCGVDIDVEPMDQDGFKFVQSDFLDAYASGEIEQADHVWVIEVLKYVSGDPMPFLNAIFDCCKRSAILSVSRPSGKDRFSSVEWCNMLEAAGFEVTLSRQLGNHVFICSKPQ